MTSPDQSPSPGSTPVKKAKGISGSRTGRILVYGVAPLLGVVVACGVLMGLVGAMAPKPETNDDPEKGLAVFATKATTQDVPLTISAQGEARPRREISLTAEVAGRITYLSPNFIDGGLFERGEVLMRIDPTNYELAVTQAEGQVAQAQSALQRERAESEIARRDWEELGQGPASALTLRQPQLAEARAQLAAAEARLADARVSLDRTEIVAPFDGRVRRKAIDIGQYVAPGGTNLGDIYATDIIEVRLPLTDAELAQVDLPVAFTASTPDEGAPVTLTGTVLGRDRVWQGAIMRTDSVIDARTRVIYAVAEVQDPYGTGTSADGVPLPVGLFVRADIAGRTIEDAIVLPRDALKGTDTMYVANEEGTLSMRKVLVANTDRTSVVITDGIASGEHVITSSVLAARDCMRIQVYNANNELLFPVPPADDGADTGSADADGEDATDADADGSDAPPALTECERAKLDPSQLAELKLDTADDTNDTENGEAK